VCNSLVVRKSNDELDTDQAKCSKEERNVFLACVFAFTAYMNLIQGMFANIPLHMVLQDFSISSLESIFRKNKKNEEQTYYTSWVQTSFNTEKSYP